MINTSTQQAAEKLVADTKATYNRQVLEGRYLCDKPMSLDEAYNYLSDSES